MSTHSARFMSAEFGRNDDGVWWRGDLVNKNRDLSHQRWVAWHEALLKVRALDVFAFSRFLASRPKRVVTASLVSRSFSSSPLAGFPPFSPIQMGKRSNVVISANNMYDVHYIKYHTDIDAVLIPSSCLGELNGAEYKPVKPEIIIGGSRNNVGVRQSVVAY